MVFKSPQIECELVNQCVYRTKELHKKHRTDGEKGKGNKKKTVAFQTYILIIHNHNIAMSGIVYMYGKL